MAGHIPRCYPDGARSEPVADPDALVRAGVRYAVVPDTSHNIMLDNPEHFVRAVTESLDQAPAAPAQ